MQSVSEGAPIEAPAQFDAGRANRYIARILQQQLVDHPDARHWERDGTAVFIDVSGFTRLSERLAQKGKEGAEQITDAIAASFEAILEVAYDCGGSLLKFGGDALLLWFEGDRHAARACHATIRMRKVLRVTGRIALPGANVVLRMAQGVHSGRFHFFALGESHIELLTAGPGWSRVTAMLNAANAGEVVISDETGAMLPQRCIGTAQGPGFRLRRDPPGPHEKLPLKPRPVMTPSLLARCLSPAIRTHVFAGGGTPEHRPVTIAFIRFEGVDAMIERGGAAADEALDGVVTAVQRATQEHDVAFLGTDIDTDGGKLILTAGAPKATGDDEERMLLALRRIVDSDLPLPVRIGVHRGSVFAGDIGPFYRRTYTVMGDAVNLAARLMAEAPPGQIYATAEVIGRSNTSFATEELPPLTVRGKSKPVHAFALGRAVGSRARGDALEMLPLIGRDAELAMSRKRMAKTRSGAGGLIEISGESGIGKTRLLEALREEAADFATLHAACEAYTASAPYSLWRELLREHMGFGRDDADAIVAERLKAEIAARVPELLPWLALIAIPFDLNLAPSPEVLMLAEKNRQAKMHEVIAPFLDSLMPGPTLIEIENAQHMDVASAALLSSLAGKLETRPWLIAVARRPGTTGFVAPDASAVSKLALEPLGLDDTKRLVEIATERHSLPLHAQQLIAQRAGGNPQYLRDLLHSVIESGGVGRLPDSAEAAALARIDRLAPEDREIVRRAAVFGSTFHPRMLSWFADENEGAVATEGTWRRLGDWFEEEPDGYVRFSRAPLREAAYDGLPYKLRRRLHGVVASRLEEESDAPEESAEILSLHWFVAGNHQAAWRYANIAGKRADAVYAYVEAARLYSRALEAGRRLEGLAAAEIAAVQESVGDSWHRAGDYHKAAAAFDAARRLARENPLKVSSILLKRSWMEEKLGDCPQAVRSAVRARKSIDTMTTREAAQQNAQLSAWQATLLLAEGRPRDAVRWARKAIQEAEAIADDDAQGSAHFALGWALSELGGESPEPHWQRSLEAYRRSGNRVRQAGLLLNLGVACLWEGRWDDALANYERARAESLRIGNTADAELARINSGEILVDRGQIEEAEALLNSSLHVWRALDYRYFMGLCLSYLGRAMLRASRLEDAIRRFEGARALIETAGSPQEAQEVDGRIAECRAFMRDSQAALDIAERTLGHADASNTKLLALLERVRGYALAQKGDVAHARSAFAASLAAARKRRDPFEIAQTLRALAALDRLEGIEPSPAVVGESESLLTELKVQNLLEPPLTAQ
jgi:class 3 adenylate cyclase/tetratricopeptide (TPR) repeat protein